MKSYHILPCDDLAEIQRHTLAWVDHNQSDLWQRADLWHFVDGAKFLADSPCVTHWLRTLKLVPRGISFTVLTREDPDVNIHIDEPPSVCKINVPILNGAHTHNVWYRVPQHLLDDPQHRKINRFGKHFHTFPPHTATEMTEIARVECVVPILFNSQQAHTVQLEEGAQLPRLVLSIALVREPVELLAD